MRLTLRTLLAWLDDTLPPGEVRQIGQQVTESPLASDLVEKIHRVTRQRRLTVPPGTGTDGVDPNIVAGYLADELPTEVVAEYEKRCLTSDVALAEVASVHQILSLLGQKAKVPAEAKFRMYHLIKGREAAPTPVSRPSTRKPEPKTISAWTPEPIPPRSLLERFGPAAVILALIAVLFWSASMSFRNGKVEPTLAKGPETTPPVPVVPPKVVPANVDETPKDTAIEPVDKPPPDKPVEAEAPILPAGSVGVVGQGDFVLFRQSGAAQTWERLRADAVIRDGDHLLNLTPFLTPIQVGSAKLTMIGDSEIRVGTPGNGFSARFEILRGQIRLTGVSREPIALGFDAATLKLTVPDGAVAGLEVHLRRALGEPTPGSPGLGIMAAEGTVTVEVEGTTEELSAASTKFVSPKSLSADVPLETVPWWLTDATLPPGEQTHAKEFAAYFKPDRATKSCLVEALDDPKPRIRFYAISGLAAIGQLDLIISTMSQKDNPESRRAAVAALRDVVKRSPQTAKDLRTRLESVGGSKAWADDVEAMLIGYPKAAANDEAITAKLLKFLTHDDVGIRELAIQTLQNISDRADRLGYDPDKPTDPTGVQAWATLIERKELRIPPTPKPR